MLTLGDVLALSRRSAANFDRLQMAPEFAAAVDAAAAAEGVHPRTFLRIAVADFANDAGPGDWTRLMSKLRDSADPGGECLKVMLERRLAAARRLRLVED